MSLTLVLGGQKSGKSSTAARLAREQGAEVVVVTPARADDPELAERIERHREDRPDAWRTIERFDLAAVLAGTPADATVLIDALDTWLVERMGQVGLWSHAEIEPLGEDGRWASDALLDELEAVARAAADREGLTVVVAGQPGVGPHPMGADARRYVDLHGLGLQRLAAHAGQVLMVTAGRAIPIDRQPSIERPTGRPQAAPWPGRDAPRIAPVDVMDMDTAEAELAALGRAVPGRNGRAEASARAHAASLATPPGALGELAETGVVLAGITGRCPPGVPRRPALVVGVGDHGVHAQGVTPWPQALTTVIADVLAAGRAGAAVLADEVGARVTVLDVGSAGSVAEHPCVVHTRVVAGTADLRQRDAMGRLEALRALLAGARTAAALIADGADLLITGDVGIANTTPSAALVGALTGRSAAEVTGPGTGIDDVTLERKRKVVDDALARVAGRDPLGVLAAVGGAEHAALSGLVLAAAGANVPVVLDGIIADAAALVAVALCPAAAHVLIAGHRSPEPGARAALEHLGLRALLDLDMRLGEGSGALLAVPLIQAAARVMRDVATFADLGLDGPAPPPQ